MRPMTLEAHEEAIQYWDGVERRTEKRLLGADARKQPDPNPGWSRLSDDPEFSKTLPEEIPDKLFGSSLILNVVFVAYLTASGLSVVGIIVALVAGFFWDRSWPFTLLVFSMLMARVMRYQINEFELYKRKREESLIAKKRK
jgi:hypothetical protein